MKFKQVLSKTNKSFVALAVMATLFLAGCGGGNSDAVTPSTTASKRSAVIYPQPDSPIYFVDTAPDGTGIVARRGASGSVSTMDIITPEGIYYQLILGGSGLSKLKLSGFEISVLATDANNEVTQIAVEDSSGVVTLSGLPLGKRMFATTSDPKCANPDGTVGLEDADFPKTFGCNVAILARDQTWTAANSLFNYVANKLENANNFFTGLKRDAAKLLASRSAEEVPVEINQFSDDLYESRNVIVSTDTTVPPGSDEEVSRDVVADTIKLGMDKEDTDLATIDPSKLQTVSGAPVISPPVICTAPAVLVDGACVAPASASVPVVNAITPSQATVNQSATFNIAGTGLTSGMGFTLESCSVIKELAGGSSTSRQFSCTPVASGPKVGYIKDKPAGTLLYTFHVQVAASSATPGIGPTVTGISPSSGAVGSTVTITGSNFSTTPGNNTVKMNGTQATVTAATATSLTVTVPAGATSGNVSVTTANGTTSSTSSFTVSTSTLSDSEWFKTYWSYSITSSSNEHEVGNSEGQYVSRSAADAIARMPSSSTFVSYEGCGACGIGSTIALVLTSGGQTYTFDYTRVR